MSKELAKQAEVGALALSNDDIGDIFGESSLEANKLTFPEIAIMRESPVFDLGSGELVKSLTGHVLYTHPAFAWYEKDFNEREKGERTPPNCASSHGVKPDSGDDIQSELCATCPKFQYGSGKNEKGSACRLGARMLFLGDGEAVPSVINLPPTSTLGKESSYNQWLSKVINAVFSSFKRVGTTLPANKQHCWPAQVEMSLTPKAYDSGAASILNIKTIGVLVNDTPENLVRLKELAGIQKWAVDIYHKEIEQYAAGMKPVESTVVVTDKEAAEEVAEDNIPI